MLSLEVRELAEKLKTLSWEDQQWLLQQLIQQMSSNEESKMSQSNSLLTSQTSKIFNITPAIKGSGYQDTVVNHDQVFVNSILDQ